MKRVLAGIFVVVLSASVAQAAVSPQVRGQKIRDFVRLTFEWPEATLFTAKTSGNNVIITFDRKATIKMGAVLKQLHPYIVKAEAKADGKTVVLTLDAPHRIRTFISDNVSGIDLLDVQKTASKVPQIAKQKEAPQLATAALARLAPAAGEEASPAAKIVSAQPKVESVAETPKPAIPASEEKFAQVKTAEGAQPVNEAGDVASPPKAAEVTEVAKPAIVPVQEEAPAKPATEDAAAVTAKTKETPTEGSAPRRADALSMVPMVVNQAEEEKTEEEQTSQAATTAGKAPTVELSEETEKQEPLTSNKIVVSADTDGATLRIPLKTRTAAAIFVRINTLWVILDKKLEFDFSDFEGLSNTVLGKATVLPHDKATILRVAVKDNIYPVIRQEEGRSDIAIILSSVKNAPQKPLDIQINTEPPVPAHVFVPALEVGTTVEFDDPDIGNTLLATPVYTREQGIADAWDFVDFSLLSSMQGVVVAKKSDATEITVLRNGLRISLPKGARLSPMPTDEQAGKMVVSAVAAGGTLFPGELWKLEANKNLKYTMRNLLQQTVFSSTEGAKNLARLRLAQLYLYDGMVVEALGMLEIIHRSNPSYYRSEKLSAMRGAANFLLYRFNDAARDFAAAELNNNPEIAYWREMLADLLGNPDKTYDFIEINKNYISKYPPVFRQRLAIVAADRAVAAKEPNVALKIFDTLAKDNILTPIQSYVDYLTARIAADSGQEKEAVATWKQLSENSPNHFVQARAAFSAILWELDNNTITGEQAADQLERLRLRWHGDGLELQIVQLLGDLYSEQQDYVNAMRVWQIGATGFRNTGPAIDMEQKMRDTFSKLFSDDIAKSMTPLEVLALYYEYRNYMPSGPAGLQMVEKLADRLIGVDLLSTATQLLEQHMRTTTEKAERSRIGAKLAEVYLNNEQPKRALKALQESAYGDNPILQRIQRNQLTARVMTQLGRTEEALTALGQDESANAEKIRATIYWEQEQWEAVASSIENMFKKRPDPSVPLNRDEGEFALRLALSYGFLHDADQVRYMKDYFGPLMQGNSYEQAFTFVTAPDVNLNTRNFDELLAFLSKTRNFVGTYQTRLASAEGS